MSRLIPILIAVVAIAALTVVEGLVSERWGDNRLCAYCVTLLDDVPKEIGGWVGTDAQVDGDTQEVAGARGYVSRTYVNEASGATVGVWLIVGHARDTADHVPTVCYSGSGFETEESRTRQSLTLEDGSKADFFTALFGKELAMGDIKERVYWTWFEPESGSDAMVEWKAPETISWDMAASPALYKLYFTSSQAAAMVDPDKNVCLDFAREFLPAVNPLLRPANGQIPDEFEPSAEDAG